MLTHPPAQSASSRRVLNRMHAQPLLPPPADLPPHRPLPSSQAINPLVSALNATLSNMTNPMSLGAASAAAGASASAAQLLVGCGAAALLLLLA